MDAKTYQRESAATDHDANGYLDCAVRSGQNIELIHYAMGMVTESAEFTDALKKTVFYGKELDHANLVEELGDVLWYVARACSVLGVSMEGVMEINNAKLRTRYPEGFRKIDALNRDLEAERRVLES